MKRITDPEFRYYSSANTDLRRTFARVKREQKAQREREEAEAAARKVLPIKREAK